MATYSGVIDLRVTGNAEEKAEKIKRNVQSLKDLARGLKPIPNLFDNRTQDQDIKKAKQELRGLVEEYGKGTNRGRRFSNTIAGLNSQLSAFNRVIANVNVGSDEFVESLTASERISRKLAKAEAERLSVLTKVNTANTVGRAGTVQDTLDLSKVIPKSLAGLELYSQELQENFRNVEIGSQAYKELREEILRVNAAMRDPVMSGSAPSSPIGGRADIPGSPAALRARRQGRGQRLRDVATGAGFPLLFGGGPLQALAGGLGGAAGGLGGSIAASAITAQFEAFALEATKVGQALNSTGEALELVREKSLFSKDETEERARKLEKLGDVEGLAALLTQELTDKIGNEGVRSLQELGKTTDETTRLWNELTLQLFTLVSGPLNDFLKLVNNFLKGFTAESRLASFRSGLNEKDRARFEEIFLDVRRQDVKGNAQQRARRGIGTGTAPQIEKAIRIAQAEGIGVPEAGLIPVTDADRDSITPPKGGRSKRDRTPGLQAELQLQERLFVLNRDVAKAVITKNKNAQAGLQIDIELERLAAEKAKIAASDLDAQDKVLKTRIAELQANEKIASIVERKNQSEQKRAEAAALTIQNLQNEQNLVQAALDGTEKEERIKQAIAKATKDMTAAEKEKVEAIIRGTAALKEQKDVQDKLQKVYDQIGSTIANSIVSGIQAAVDQTKTLAEVASDTLRNIANILLQLGVNTLLKSTKIDLFKNLPGFANGGNPPVNRPSIVGERGPELFVPRSSGTIIPNNALGGGANVTVNVDASGSNVQGDSNQASQLGKAIGAAVQAELVKQKRPGGLLAGV